MDFMANVFLFCDNEGGLQKLNVFALNAETTEEKEIAQLQYRCFLALARTKRKIFVGSGLLILALIKRAQSN